MCGRFTLRQPDLLAERFQAQLMIDGDILPRFNVAPTQSVPIVVDDQGLRELRRARWGLIPSWAKDPSIGNRLINARSETLSEKPSFRSALRSRRCLVPADGFYEWQRTPAGSTPFFVQRQDAGVFAFAGLFEQWRDAGGQQVTTCTIITTEPNEMLLHGGIDGGAIHDRMPAILLPDDEALWLGPDAAEHDTWRAFLQPYPAEWLHAHPVTTRVNSPANDAPDLVMEHSAR